MQISNETLAEYTDLLSDFFFVHGIDQSVKAHAKYSKGKSYYYRYVEHLFLFDVTQKNVM